MGWLKSIAHDVEDVASDVVGGVEAVGSGIGDAASAVGSAVEDAGDWVGDHATSLGEGALAAAGMIPGLNIVTEGAQTLWHEGAMAYDLATGDDKGALKEGEEAALHGAATALNLFTGEGGEVLSVGADLAEGALEEGGEMALEKGAETIGESAITDAAETVGETAATSNADEFGALAEKMLANGSAMDDVGEEGADQAVSASAESSVEAGAEGESSFTGNLLKAAGVKPLLEEDSALHTGLEAPAREFGGRPFVG